MKRCAFFGLGVAMVVGCGGSTGDKPPPILFADAAALPACASAPMKLNLANVYSKALEIAVDDVHVYWLADDGTVYRVKKEGGYPIAVMPGGSSFCSWTGCSFTMDGTDVYVSIGGVTRISKKTLAKTFISESSLSTHWTSNMIAVDTDSVYATTSGGVAHTTKAPGIWDGPMWSMLALDAGQLWQVAVTQTDAFVTSTAFSFEGNTYGTTGLWRVPLSGEPPTKIAGVTTMATPMTLDGTTLYMIDAELPRIVSVDTTTGQPHTVGDIDATTGNVAVDSAYVYWSFDHGIRAVPKAGGAAQSIPTLEQGATSTVVAADDQCLYWVETVDGNAMTVVAGPKPSGN